MFPLENSRKQIPCPVGVKYDSQPTACFLFDIKTRGLYKPGTSSQKLPKTYFCTVERNFFCLSLNLLSVFCLRVGEKPSEDHGTVRTWRSTSPWLQQRGRLWGRREPWKTQIGDMPNDSQKNTTEGLSSSLSEIEAPHSNTYTYLIMCKLETLCSIPKYTG